MMNKSICTKEYYISFIRMISFIFIVACHMLQFFNNEIAFWLNVGVQIFIFISGYLYGKKSVKQIDIAEFYKNRMLKILIPYYSALIPVILIHIFLLNKNISIYETINMLICHSTIRGGEHLWFVSTILMCYLLTPIFQGIIKHKTKHSFIISGGVLILATFIFFFFFNTYHNYKPAWIICYIIGYAYGINCENKVLNEHTLNLIFIILSLQNIPQIINDYFYNIVNSDNTFYEMWCNFNHVWLGISLFVLLKHFFKSMHLEKYVSLKRILDYSDKYSYEGYLVHQFMILGPLSLMCLTPSTALNICIIIFMIFAFAFILKSVTNPIYKLFDRIIKRLYINN